MGIEVFFKGRVRVPQLQTCSFFCMNQVLRIWDTHLQVCLQRLSGMFPKGPSEGNRPAFLILTTDMSLKFKSFRLQFLRKTKSQFTIISNILLGESYNWMLESCLASM